MNNISMLEQIPAGKYTDPQQKRGRPRVHPRAEKKEAWCKYMRNYAKEKTKVFNELKIIEKEYADLKDNFPYIIEGLLRQQRAQKEVN